MKHNNNNHNTFTNIIDTKSINKLPFDDLYSTDFYYPETDSFLYFNRFVKRNRTMKMGSRVTAFTEDLVKRDYNATFYNGLKTFFVINTGLLVHYRNTHTFKPLTATALIKLKIKDVFISYSNLLYHTAASQLYRNIKLKIFKKKRYYTLPSLMKQARPLNKVLFYTLFEKLQYFSFKSPIYITYKFWRNATFKIMYLGFKLRIRSRYNTLKRSVFKRFLFKSYTHMPRSNKKFIKKRYQRLFWRIANIQKKKTQFNLNKLYLKKPISIIKSTRNILKKKLRILDKLYLNNNKLQLQKILIPTFLKPKTFKRLRRYYYKRPKQKIYLSQEDLSMPEKIYLSSFQLTLIKRYSRKVNLIKFYLKTKEFNKILLQKRLRFPRVFKANVLKLKRRVTIQRIAKKGTCAKYTTVTKQLKKIRYNSFIRYQNKRLRHQYKSATTFIRRKLKNTRKHLINQRKHVSATIQPYSKTNLKQIKGYGLLRKRLIYIMKKKYIKTKIKLNKYSIQHSILSDNKSYMLLPKIPKRSRKKLLFRLYKKKLQYSKRYPYRYINRRPFKRFWTINGFSKKYQRNTYLTLLKQRYKALRQQDKKSFIINLKTIIKYKKRLNNKPNLHDIEVTKFKSRDLFRQWSYLKKPKQRFNRYKRYLKAKYLIWPKLVPFQMFVRIIVNNNHIQNRAIHKCL